MQEFHLTQPTTGCGRVADFTAGLKDGVKGLRIGVPREFFIEGIQPEVEQAVRAAIEQFAALGADVREITRIDRVGVIDHVGETGAAGAFDTDTQPDAAPTLAQVTLDPLSCIFRQ